MPRQSINSFFSNSVSSRQKSQLSFESLEQRRLLTTTGFDSPGELPIEQIASETAPLQQDGISSLVIDRNGELLSVKLSLGILELHNGDEIRVAEIGFDSVESSGVFAAEGYVHKLHDADSPTVIDYADGRFSAREANADATGGAGTIAGMSDAWVVETGWDRLTINLMHYTETGVSVADLVVVKLQVGQPDFEFDTGSLDRIGEQLIRVGDEVEISGAWHNTLEGVFHNYAEVDVYHSSDMNTIVWAGSTAGAVGADNTVSGVFTNRVTDDAFSELWTPDQTGEYVLKYYLDPEGVVAEANEDNNEYEVSVIVEAKPAPQAIADNFDADLSRLDVLANDVGGDPQQEMFIEEFSQPEHGTVVLNEDGTLGYQADPRFSGMDQFKYTVREGDQVSDAALVTVEVVDSFHVPENVDTLEDAPFELGIETSHPAVMIIGIPDGAEINIGKRTSFGVGVVLGHQLPDLQMTPPSNSDVDFQLTIVPVTRQGLDRSQAQTLNVSITPVIDGGELHVENVEVVTGKKVNLPTDLTLMDQDGSENHVVKFSGVPEFMKLSKGEFDGTTWMLQPSDLDGLRILSSRANDVSDWDRHSRKYVHKAFEIAWELQSMEADSEEIRSVSGSFVVDALQKYKK
ncbi:MAG: Ig-like domain-containing protein [Pirellulaceae bacterium]